MNVRVLGVRHHSPACARLVAHTIAKEKPYAVLIEGPSDFNSRLDELLLEHRPPLALYSYANAGARPSQCWFPFLDYSPEWVALRSGHAVGALLRFIDLPHWQYRAMPEAHQHTASVSPTQKRSHYAEVVAKLCQRFHCDDANTLWDHLFEALPEQGAESELQQRLALYFDELRGNDPGSEQDQARERHMARWVRWTQTGAGEKLVLVVCGGWHQRAIETLCAAAEPTLEPLDEPVMSAPDDARVAGSYLVPYTFRQVDALGGYWSGMQSPLFYQWAWQHGMASAGRKAVDHIVQQLRHRQVSLSTADLLAFEHSIAALSRMRGHPNALRTDILDALQSSLIKEALDTPPPWSKQDLLSSQDHPVLREALMVLTGDATGQLHKDTPLPPLLHDVNQRLAQCDVQLRNQAQALVLDRRNESDSQTAHVLWQLHILGLSGVQLKDIRAPQAAHGLPEVLRFEEHWSLRQDQQWFPQLIEAAAYGATLRTAACNRILERIFNAQDNVQLITQCLLDALRGDLRDIGLDLAEQLGHIIPQSQDHIALAEAAHQLLQLARTGFWGLDTRPLLDDTLSVMAHRILWILETCQSNSPGQIMGDVNAVCVFDEVLRLPEHTGPALDATFFLETLSRFAHETHRPPAIRGAALAVVYVHNGLGEAASQQIIAITRATPPRDDLGDFLYGLFSCARALATESDEITQAVQAALESMSTEDFLVALPKLRGAFAWFPPRERTAIAAWVARLLGLSGAEHQRLLSLHQGPKRLLDAKLIEAQALAWAHDIGVNP